MKYLKKYTLSLIGFILTIPLFIIGTFSFIISKGKFDFCYDVKLIDKFIHWVYEWSFQDN